MLVANQKPVQNINAEKYTNSFFEPFCIYFLKEFIYMKQLIGGAKN